MSVAGGVARRPRDPALWRAGWQHGQEPLHSGSCNSSAEVRIARAGPLGNPAAALQQRHTGKPNLVTRPSG